MHFFLRKQYTAEDLEKYFVGSSIRLCSRFFFAVLFILHKIDFRCKPSGMFEMDDFMQNSWEEP